MVTEYALVPAKRFQKNWWFVLQNIKLFAIIKIMHEPPNASSYKCKLIESNLYFVASDGGVSPMTIVEMGITMLTYELMVYHCSKGYCAVLPPELKMLESHYQRQMCFTDGLPGELLSGTERDNVIFRGRVVLEQVLNCARFDNLELPEPIKWSKCRDAQPQLEFVPVECLKKGTIQIYEGRHVRFYHNSLKAPLISWESQGIKLVDKPHQAAIVGNAFFGLCYDWTA